MNHRFPLIKKGSVKNIYDHHLTDHLLFEFSDQFSVFDWGAMPDTIEGKGNNQAGLACSFFQYFASPTAWQKTIVEVPDELKNSTVAKELCEHGLKNHFVEKCSEEGRHVAREEESNYLKVQKFSVIEPLLRQLDGQSYWDYSRYLDRKVNCLVPLEVIFRFGVPMGSSILRRYAKNVEYFNEIGIHQKPCEGDVFEKPVVEFSTKLEPEDRMLSKSEAQSIAGMSTEEMENLTQTVTLMAYHLKGLFKQTPLTLWDGKFEFSFLPGEENRTFCMIDSLGIDELRITYQNLPLSKEFLRQYYHGSHWAKAAKKAKQLARERGLSEWKEVCRELCPDGPPKLAPEYKKMSEQVYSYISESLEDICQGKADPIGEKHWEELRSEYFDWHDKRCQSHSWEREFQGTL